MGIPYAVQLADKDRDTRAALAAVVPDSAWLTPFPSPESGFRNRAKLVAGGEPGRVTLGILDRNRRGVDLIGCGLYEPALADALLPLAELVDDLRLLPYDVTKARGELKHVHVTASPDGRVMVRFVLRSDRQAQRIRDAVPALSAAVPGLRVATINYLPEHVALLEGDEEEFLTGARTLPIDLGRMALHVGPRSFFQTNTAVAAGLYEAARDWLATDSPASVIDLFCGVGGFGLYAATLPAAPAVLGVEVSEDAVASARHTLSNLRDNGIGGTEVEFRVADVDQVQPELAGADCVIVNPPRRGLGAGLASTIAASSARTLIYSSCNPVSLADDLAVMQGFGVRQARVFDMFPQTSHAEVLVIATR